MEPEKVANFLESVHQVSVVPLNILCSSGGIPDYYLGWISSNQALFHKIVIVQDLKNKFWPFP
jgi:hypothetical protein